MAVDYSPLIVEQQAQESWKKTKRFMTHESLDHPPYYALAMLPYPSGDLHMGHVRNYVLSDIVARFQRIKGKNVLQPIGWDAFGLPADNAAKQHQIAPEIWTENNIKQMRTQLLSLGCSYDWTREINTSQPNYYRWNQWLMIQLFKSGLAYRKSSEVNWDPVDQTVLANEQVIQGRGWRSGALIERKKIPQWFFKTTHYAEALHQGLAQLSGWPKQVVDMQRHWIGRKSGTQVVFHCQEKNESLMTFTTRVDTLMGCTYLAISPQHPWAIACSQNQPKLKKFLDEFNHQPLAEAVQAEKEKLGFLTPIQVIHPITQKQLPVWVSNYVLHDYGQGAVMGVPAHDERDFAFAKKYHIPILPVITPTAQDTPSENTPYTAYGSLKNAGEFSGLTSEKAIQAINAWLTQHQMGQPTIEYRLRDWGISRQRFWGTPIPMVHCQTCGIIPISEDDLPLILPTHLPLEQRIDGLAHCSEYLQTTCPKCNQPALRDSDTMDTFVDSSWYYLRYACYDQSQAMLDDRAKYWSPINHYIGGIEHATMHLLYARFIFKALRNLQLVNTDEPFLQLTTQGMVLNQGQKMSKSKGNTIKPESIIKKYGADALRLFIVFQAPPEQDIEWNEKGIEGAYRFLSKVWSLAQHYQSLPVPKIQTSIDSDLDLIKPIRHQIHQNLKQINQDMDRNQWNTTVSGAMKLFNALQPFKASNHLNTEEYKVFKEGISILLRVLSPISPHLSFILWEQLFPQIDMFKAGWPAIDASALQQDQFTLIVQINSKIKARVNLPLDTPESESRKTALNLPKIANVISNTALIKRTIFVPNKLINFIV